MKPSECLHIAFSFSLINIPCLFDGFSRWPLLIQWWFLSASFGLSFFPPQTLVLTLFRYGKRL